MNQYTFLDFIGSLQGVHSRRSLQVVRICRGVNEIEKKPCLLSLTKIGSVKPFSNGYSSFRRRKHGRHQKNRQSL